MHQHLVRVDQKILETAIATAVTAMVADFSNDEAANKDDDRDVNSNDNNKNNNDRDDDSVIEIPDVIIEGIISKLAQKGKLMSTFGGNQVVRFFDVLLPITIFLLLSTCTYLRMRLSANKYYDGYLLCSSLNYPILKMGELESNIVLGEKNCTHVIEQAWFNCLILLFFKIFSSSKQKD